MSTVAVSPDTNANGIADDYEHYEIVNGQRVELPPMGAYQSVLASYLGQILGSFALTKDLGRVVVETLFQLDREGKLQRKPDVAFVSFGRWPKKRRVPDTNAWDVVPDLAVEVICPTNTMDEILEKLRDYFKSRVERVWVIHPGFELIYVYSSPTKNIILAANDDLDGEAVLPGFRFPISELFQSSTDELPSATGTGPVS